ncbi:MAG: glycoside hydrolase family 10 protein [Microcoleaceae cyanobacterium]
MVNRVRQLTWKGVLCQVRGQRFRQFCRLFLLSILIFTLIGVIPMRVQAARTEIRGVWMTTNDSLVFRDHARLHNTMRQLSQVNFNTLYPVVWNAGYALYPSQVVQQAGIQHFVYRGLQGQDVLADIIAQAHQQGLLAIPWFEFGFMAPPTSELALQHPEWLTHKRNGGQTSISAAGEVVWLNPFHPQVQQFITSLVLEIMTRYDADGIQFDDHMSLPNAFGYDNYTASLYRQETGQSPPSDPEDPDWVRWRANKITAFMESLHKAVKAKKPKTIFSVAPNYYDFAYKLQLQDWVAWLNKGLIDELVVQVYRDNLQSFTQKIVQQEIEAARQKVPTAVGIMAGVRNNPVPLQRIQSQVQASRRQSLGTVFFYYESLWNYAPESPPERLSGFQALFPRPAQRLRNNSGA